MHHTASLPCFLWLWVIVALFSVCKLSYFALLSVVNLIPDNLSFLFKFSIGELLSPFISLRYFEKCSCTMLDIL